MSFLNVVILYFALILNFITAIVRPTKIGPFLPDLWIPILVLVCIQFGYVKGLFISILISYLVSLFSIFPTSVYLFVGVISYAICKLIFEFSSWKNISVLTMLTAALTALADVLFIISTRIATELDSNWFNLLLTLPSRALLNALALHLYLTYIMKKDETRVFI